MAEDRGRHCTKTLCGGCLIRAHPAEHVLLPHDDDDDAGLTMSTKRWDTHLGGSQPPRCSPTDDTISQMRLISCATIGRPIRLRSPSPPPCREAAAIAHTMAILSRAARRNPEADKKIRHRPTDHSVYLIQR
jgi:hypothetical protein